eukprot:GHRQ01015299.1.p1 GENE.GHRQ01015299.1~~GHRQ01015299.1.p1  ORF type:complete len:332 (+),score=124.34 GHRQ01015299.1:413-1408(+)
MVLGLNGVVSILGGLATGKSMETLELTEFPNMPFLYWLAVAGAVVKPKWTDSKQWPALKVSMNTPTPIQPKRLKNFKALAAWPDNSRSSVPMMFLMAESFKLVMQVLTLPSFPVSVLGTVVNKRARYSYLRKVDAAESLTYSCKLNPAVRETFSGHAEFDLLLEAVSHDKSDVVWQAVLSMVLMNPKKSKGGKKEGAAASSKPAEEEVSGEAFDTWVLPENTGRAYAALDGDISPMHLYKATAMLMGFPSPVANVHLLAARTEASIAAKKGVCGAFQCSSGRVAMCPILCTSRPVCWQSAAEPAARVSQGPNIVSCVLRPHLCKLGQVQSG